MERYERIEKNAPVGKGTYGVVYKAKDKTTGKYVAMKKIKLESEDEGLPSTTLREISVLRQLKHVNIIELSDVVQSEGRLHLVFEFVDKDLKKYLDSVEGSLSDQVVQSFLLQMLEGLYYCHQRGVIHRDMKPQNILVSKEGCIKIADFGLARAYIPPIRPFTHEVVTLWYRAPEVLLGCRTYTTAIDLWSVGVIFSEMVTKKPLFPGDSEIDELYKIFRLLGTPNENNWPGVTSLQDWNTEFPIWPSLNIAHIVPGLSAAGVDLLEEFLILDPDERIPVDEALEHPYFHMNTSTNYLVT